MPQSLSNLLVHVVFSTKGRMNFILPDVKDDLYAYMRGIGRELKAPVIEIGGVEDHLSEVVQNLKSGSSRFIKEKSLCCLATSRGRGVMERFPRRRRLWIGS